MKYVIIGNSTAAVGCIEGIRQRDRRGGITLVAGEPHHTYSRPLISYLLAGKTDEERMRYRPEDFYSKNNVRTMLGRTAARIDPAKKQVHLEGGEVVPYDKLLVATGSTPAVPAIQGLDKVENQTPFQTLDHARYLDKAVTKHSEVLILGAGLIGLKCAEGLAKRAGGVTVVDMADHILPSILDADAARPVEEHLRRHGVQLILSDSAKRFSADTAQLQSGRDLPFDVLVVAVGVRPSTALVGGAGGAVNRGIVVDENSATSLPHIYAAGDCTESVDISSGERRVLALLPDAYRQGHSAGLHMAGEEQPYRDAIPMNAIGLFGKHILTAGSYTGTCHAADSEDGMKRLYTQDGVLKGFMMVGDVARAGIYTALVRERTPLSAIDFDLIKERPQLMAFSRTQRAEKLGGVRT